METSSLNNQQSNKVSVKRKISTLIHSRKFMYVFMMALLVYLLLCGYVLIFSGSIFYEGLVKGGYKADASDYDLYSLVWGYLFGLSHFIDCFCKNLTKTSGTGPYTYDKSMDKDNVEKDESFKQT